MSCCHYHSHRCWYPDEYFDPYPRRRRFVRSAREDELSEIKRNGTFWSEDFDELKKSLKISDRKRQRSAIDIARPYLLTSVGVAIDDSQQI